MKKDDTSTFLYMTSLITGSASRLAIAHSSGPTVSDQMMGGPGNVGSRSAKTKPNPIESVKCSTSPAISAARLNCYNVSIDALCMSRTIVAPIRLTGSQMPRPLQMP